ncbi:MAG: hypothetical protein ACI9KN_001262 [Gammaproteobacteria bacterium]|jgi:hypothetical protein
METNTTHSKQVIDDFKKHKLANSAMHKIHRLIKRFDDDRKSDANWARTGLIALIIFLIGLSIYFSGTTLVQIS